MKRIAYLFLLSLACVPAFVAVARAADRTPRRVERFDSDWRFRRGDAPGAERETFDDKGWRRVSLPHDFSIEDLPPVNTPQQAALAVTPGLWRFKLGDDPAWKGQNFDDAGWQTVTLPAGWRSHVTGNIANTYGWYRRRITVPPSLRGKDVLLLLGKVDDADETFVNGVKVGGLGSFPPSYATAWETSRRYPIPARLLKGDGTDVVAVRVYNGDGDGGIYQASGTPRRSGPFDSEAPGGSSQGYMEGDVGWYRKTFTLPGSDRGRRVGLMFDGAYMDAQVWLNGHPLGRHPYGYTSFVLDATPYAQFGRGRNVLAVRVDAAGRTSRWYSGAGLYRHVWLSVTDPVHVAAWGTYVTTPQVSAAQATVRVRTTVENAQTAPQGIGLTMRLVDPAGAVVATGQVQGTVPASGRQEFTATLAVPRPRLWSPDTPTLYRLVTDVSTGGKVIDETATTLGLRSISFDAARGFLLNGVPLKMRGGCVHHDNGPLGSAAYDRAEERRVALLKAAGFNAIRTSHNPPSPAFLDACDRLGVLVMDEAFDCWRHGKNPQDYGRFFDQWWQADIDSMVLRDRNHPSIVVWSIGNEIPEQRDPEGAATGARLADRVRALDPTRPVAQATNPDADKLDPLLAHLDVTGYNYAAGRFVADHAKHPDRVFAQTESFPTACFEGWMTTLDNSFDIGDFVWTALDYLGEAGIGRDIYPGDPGGFGGDYPYSVSGCGDLDLIGDRKPQSFYRGIVWGVGPRVAAFADAVADGEPGYRVSGWGWPDERASWTWPGTEGKTRTVRVYANTPRVRLLLNGRDLGEKETTRATRYTATYSVAYEPGTLTAVGLGADGQETARWTLATAGPPASLRLTPDRTTLSADGEDLSYVAVDVLDAHGVLVPNADALVHFALSGPGTIVAVGSADPRGVESFQQPQRRAFRGRCLVVIRGGDKAGRLRLTAQATGLRGAEVTLQTRRMP